MLFIFVVVLLFSCYVEGLLKDFNKCGTQYVVLYFVVFLVFFSENSHLLILLD